MEITTSFLLRHLHPLPPPRPPPWPSFYSLGNRHSLHIRFRLFAIRSRKFDFSGLKFDDNGNEGGGDFDRKRRRRKSRGDKRPKQRRWWSVEEEEDSVPGKPRSGTLKQLTDSVWILEVLTSYGWFLPIIILSLLLANGPKAFLMAFSPPLGLSLLILAFQKLWEWLDDSPKPRRRRKKRSPFSSRNGVLMEEEEEDDLEEEIQQKRRNRKREYRSRVADHDGSVDIGNSRSRASASSFGGWDELVAEEETGVARSSSAMGPPGPEVPVEEKLKKLKRLNRSLEERDLPLLLRLLIALFPFLGSWIRE